MGGGPGPTAYMIGKKQTDLIAPRAPEVPIGTRLKYGGSFNTPGPGTYNDTPTHKYKKGTPASHTIGHRSVGNGWFRKVMMKGNQQMPNDSKSKQ